MYTTQSTGQQVPRNPVHSLYSTTEERLLHARTSAHRQLTAITERYPHRQAATKGLRQIIAGIDRALHRRGAA